MNIDQSPTRGRDIARRALVTLGALAAYWLARNVPLPGVDVAALAATGMRIFDDAGRWSIVMLGMTPLYSVLILIEIASLFYPPLRRLGAESPRSAAALWRFAFLAALVLAGMQAYGVALGFEGLKGAKGAMSESGVEFRAMLIITAIGATALLGWLAARVTEQGLGNGFWLLLSAPFMLGLPREFLNLQAMSGMGAVAPGALAEVAGWFVLSAAVLVFVAWTRARTLPPPAADPFAMVWPAILADLALGPALLGLFTLSRAVSPLVGRMILHALLIALFSLWRGWTLRPAASAPALRADLLTAVGLALVTGFAEWLTVNLRLPSLLDATGLVILTAVGVAIARSAGFLADAAPVGK